MIMLRGHHLICLHFFSGEGYNREFIENLQRVLSRTGAETVKVSESVDDICQSCPSLKDSVCHYKEDAEDEILRLDRTALNLLSLSPGETVKWKDVYTRIPSIFSKWHTMICRECGWITVCRKNDFFNKLI